MKARLRFLFIAMSLLAGVHQAAAQGTRFFRISGPAATTITAFRPDGTMVWNNALAGTNYTVQTSSSLAGDWVDYVQLPVTSSINTNLLIAFNPPTGMVLIPAGSFTMGDTLDGLDTAIPTNVTVSAFYMDTNLVSYSQWQGVYNWATNHGYSFDNAGSGKAANHPVQTIDWYDCVKWCNARSEKEGRTPAYYTSVAQTTVYRSGQVDVDNSWVKWNVGYRLPTEAEWEKAARGGLSGQRFPWGNTISESQANYHGENYNFSYDLGPNGYNAIGLIGGHPYTSPVGSFAANRYGLYDMAGNVGEWCWDWYGKKYAGGIDPRGPTSGDIDPHRPPFGGPYRVDRGGDCLDSAFFCRTAGGRVYGYPSYGSDGGGFRSILPLGQ